MNAGLLIIILLLGLALLGFPIYIALGIGALAALNLADLQELRKYNHTSSAKLR